MTDPVTTGTVRGLVLAGGRSSRMGTDKAELRYGEKTQVQRAVELLEPWCASVHVSRAPGQPLPEGMGEEQVLRDRFLDFGPLGGLLTAFCHDRQAAWLVVACDLPLLTGRTIAFLMASRDPAAAATAFLSPDGSFPEPLCTVWEPLVHPQAFLALASGRTCPRRLLSGAQVRLLPAPGQELFNANTPDERRRAREVA